jgi:hypothetical protein
MCDKRGYRSKREAKRVVGRALNWHGPARRVYRCPDCGRWHLTSRRKRPSDGPV